MRSPSFQALEGIDAVKKTAEALGGTVYELPKDYSRLLEIIREKSSPRAFHVAVDDPAELAPFAAQDIPLIASGSAQEAADMAVLASLLARASGLPVIHFFDRLWVGGEFAKIDVLKREELDRLIEDAPAAGDGNVLESFERLCSRFKDLAGRAYGAFEYAGPPEPERIAATFSQDAEPDAATGIVRVRLWRPFDGRRFLNSFPPTVRSLAAVKALQPDLLAAIHQGIVGGWSWFTALPPMTEWTSNPPVPSVDVFEAILKSDGAEAEAAVRGLLRDLSPRSSSHFQSYTLRGEGGTEVHLRLSPNPIRRHGPVLKPRMTIALAGPVLTVSGQDLRERPIDLHGLARRAGLGDTVVPALAAVLLSLLDSERWLGLRTERASEIVLEAVQDRWGDFSAGIVEAHRRAIELAPTASVTPIRPPVPPRDGRFGAVSLKTDYMGFRLRSPLVACVSEEDPAELAASPVGAVFFGPVSEEELDREAWKTFSVLTRGKPTGFEARPPLERPLERLRAWKAAVETPVIAGIEAVSEKSWLALAFAVEQAGADAIELFLKAPEEGGPSDPLRVIGLVGAAVRVPVAARPTPALASLLTADPGALKQAGLKALVLFRAPDGSVPDPESLEIRREPLLTGSQVFRLALPVLGTLAAGDLDLGAAGPVSLSGDAIAALLSGCRAVYVTAERAGIERMDEEVGAWMSAKGFASVPEARDFGVESRSVQRRVS